MDRALVTEFAATQAGLTRALAIGLGSGLLLVLAGMAYIVRLERQTQSRYTQLGQSRLELQQLSARLVDAQETERRSISRELHDEIGQALGALLVDLGRLSTALSDDRPEVKAQVENMKSATERTFQAVRNIALLLRPSMLDDLGLVAALEWQGREVSRRSEIEVEVQSENVSDDLPDEYRICIYRMVQEALSNAVRHSGAKNAKVIVRQSPSKHHGAGQRRRPRLRSAADARTGIAGHGRAREAAGRNIVGGVQPGPGSHRDGGTPFAAEAAVMRKIRVLLADDHTLIRAGLRMVVDAQPDLTVVGEADDGRAAVAMAESLKPDVVVMDIGMPSLNGIEACRKIREILPDTQVVMLSMHSDEGYVLRALKAGAKAYLLKDSAEADLARAIRAAASGKSFFSPAVGQGAAGRLHAQAATHRRGGFLRAAVAARARDPATGGRRKFEQGHRESAEPERLHGRDAPRAGDAEAESARRSRS